MENGERIILKKQENISIEQNKLRLIRRTRTYTKERLQFPASLIDQYKTIIQKKEDSIIKNIAFDRETKITQINLKNLSNNISFQMKELKVQQCCILKEIESMSQNKPHIPNDVTWNQNLQHKNDVKKKFFHNMVLGNIKKSNQTNNKKKLFTEKIIETTITRLHHSNNMEQTHVMDNYKKLHSSKCHILRHYDDFELQQISKGKSFLPYTELNVICGKRQRSDEIKNYKENKQLKTIICKNSDRYVYCDKCNVQKKYHKRECINMSTKTRSFRENKSFLPLIFKIENCFKKEICHSRTARHCTPLTPAWYPIEKKCRVPFVNNHTKYKNLRSPKNGPQCKSKLKKQCKTAKKHISKISTLYRNYSDLFFKSANNSKKMHTTAHKGIKNVSNPQYRKDMLQQSHQKPDKYRSFNGTPKKTSLSVSEIRRKSKRSDPNVLKEKTGLKSNNIKDTHKTQKLEVNPLNDALHMIENKTILRNSKDNFNDSRVVHQTNKDVGSSDNATKDHLLPKPKVVKRSSNMEENLVQQNSSERTSGNKYEKLTPIIEINNLQFIPLETNANPQLSTQNFTDAQVRNLPEKTAQPMDDTKSDIFITNGSNKISSFNQQEEVLNFYSDKENNIESKHRNPGINEIPLKLSQEDFKSISKTSIILKKMSNNSIDQSKSNFFPAKTSFLDHQKKILSEGNNTVSEIKSPFSNASEVPYKPSHEILKPSSEIYITGKKIEIDGSISNNSTNSNNNESELTNLYTVSHNSEMNIFEDKIKVSKSTISSNASQKLLIDDQKEMFNLHSMDKNNNGSHYSGRVPSEIFRNSSHKISETNSDIKILEKNLENKNDSPIENHNDLNITTSSEQEDLRVPNIFNDSNYHSIGLPEYNQTIDLSKESISNILNEDLSVENHLTGLNQEKINNKDNESWDKKSRASFSFSKLFDKDKTNQSFNKDESVLKENLKIPDKNKNLSPRKSLHENNFGSLTSIEIPKYNKNYISDLKNLFSDQMNKVQNTKKPEQNDSQTLHKKIASGNHHHNTGCTCHKYNPYFNTTFHRTASNENVILQPIGVITTQKKYKQKLIDLKCKQNSTQYGPYTYSMSMQSFCNKYSHRTIRRKPMMEFICDVTTRYGHSIPRFRGCPCMYETYKCIIMLCYKEHTELKKKNKMK